jgi:hypothetical protein
MCPACIESAAVMAAGVGSAGGIVAMCIAKFRKRFNTSGTGQLKKMQEKKDGNKTE